MSLRRYICRFFQQDSCLAGENCRLYHILICPLYLNGLCRDGNQCTRVHIRSFLSRFYAAQQNPNNVRSSSSSDNGLNDLLDQPTCFLAAFGDCDIEKCDNYHLEKCSICEKYCLRQFRPEEEKKHTELCTERKRHFLEALEASEMVECCVCKETVLKKADPADRKFGIQSDCDHSFCIACIRSWRFPNYPASGKPAYRACPICEIPSHFLIPSDVWYFSKEKKQEIIDRYKENARFIECKHYRFSNGKCLFGDNCFYKHSVTPLMGNATPYLHVSQPVFIYVPDPYLQEQAAEITGTQMDTDTHLTGADSTADPDVVEIDPDVYNYVAGTSPNDGASSSEAFEYATYTHVYSHEFAYLLDQDLHEELANMMNGREMETYTYPTYEEAYSNVVGHGSNAEASSSNVITDDLSPDMTTLNLTVPDSSDGNSDVNDVPKCQADGEENRADI